MIHINDSITLDEHEITERFVRATGPGGRNPRRTATAVEVRLDVRSSQLPADVKSRLLDVAGRHVTAEGVLVIVSRVHRSQAKNRDAACERLIALLTRAAQPPDERVMGAPPAVAAAHRLMSKHHQSSVKRRRRPALPPA